MPTFELNKIVRTGLPEIYQSIGQQPTIEVLKGEELFKRMLEKLDEELTEFICGEKTVEGLADIQQAIEDIERLLLSGQELPVEVIAAQNYVSERIKDMKIDEDVLEAARQEKLGTKGGFVEERGGDGYIGKKVTKLVLNSADPWIPYYRNEPARFPELPDERHA